MWTCFQAFAAGFINRGAEKIWTARLAPYGAIRFGDVPHRSVPKETERDLEVVSTMSGTRTSDTGFAVLHVKLA